MELFKQIMSALILAITMFFNSISVSTPTQGEVISAQLPVSTPISVPVSNPVTEGYSVILMPDTQYYSELFPYFLESQVEWIIDNKEALNIKHVAHVGDVVQNPENIREWLTAKKYLSTLEDSISFSVVAGNHDMLTDGSSPEFDEYYRGKRSYQIVEDMLFVNLQFCPTDSDISWADGLFKANTDKIGFLTTHAFIDEAGSRDFNCYSTDGDNDGEDMWQGLVVHNPNIEFILSGHFPQGNGVEYRVDSIGNREVHQIMADYSWRGWDVANEPNIYESVNWKGGDGYLTILKFTESTLEIVSYSPYTDSYLTDDDNYLVINL